MRVRTGLAHTLGAVGVKGLAFGMGFKPAAFWTWTQTPNPEIYALQFCCLALHLLNPANDVWVRVRMAFSQCVGMPRHCADLLFDHAPSL